MAKFASTLILVVAIISVQGGPVTYDEILAAARQQQFDKVQEFPQSETDSEDEMQLRSNFGKNTEVWKPSFNSVRDLKPADGAHVYGEAEYSFHSASNIDGKTSEEHAGHKIINDDGKIEEFDFTPSSTQFPLLSPIITSLGGHSPISNDYGADYSFHHVPIGVGEMSEYISGKKVDSKNKNTALSALKLPITLKPERSKKEEHKQRSPSEEYPDPSALSEADVVHVPNQAFRSDKERTDESEATQNPEPQSSDGVSNKKSPEDGKVNGDVDYIETTNIKTLNIETTPVVPKTPLRKAVEVEHPNKNSQTVDNSNNTNDFQITGTVAYPKIFEELFSGLSIPAEIPATGGQVLEKNNAPESLRTQSDMTQKPKPLHLVSQDYIKHVASAIQDELEEISGNINKQNKNKKSDELPYVNDLLDYR
ncbi:uncharacterized protein LOC124634305 isoform X2 [Helicoverpa zea]|uniref:uncharacterized protein LOC124634305 isoform X2 n=1 Tax=Helicoverpa zea TaxID=7113 RepID=UPI001F590643|nr:uncharacterized protein LOC124634305 isoform X2 [Helicoverpa zea]